MGSANLSTKICEKCVNNIDQAFTFRRKCQETESFLREKFKIDAKYPTDISKLLAVHVKNEPQEIEYVDDQSTVEPLHIIAVDEENMDMFTVTEVPEPNTINNVIEEVVMGTWVPAESSPKKRKTPKAFVSKNDHESPTILPTIYNKMHKIGDKPFTCEICKSKFAYENHMKIHMRKKHGQTCNTNTGFMHVPNESKRGRPRKTY